MVRPRKCRRVMAAPDVTYFKPRSVPLGELEEICLSIEGFEALRLADLQGLSHEAAADAMAVSRQTFGRVLADARQCVARVLAEGSALKIQGGNYTITESTTTRIADGSISGHPPGSQKHAGALNVADRRVATGRKSPGSNIPSTRRRARDCRRRPRHSGMSNGSPGGDHKIRTNQKEDWTMTKIAISSEGPGLDEALDPRFGRAAGFIVVEPKTLDFTYVDNGASQAMGQGAGIQAAEIVANSGATVVLTGYVGPKAFRALQAAGIKVGQNLGNMTVRKAIELLGNGAVEWAQQPNRRGHGR